MKSFLLVGIIALTLTACSVQDENVPPITLAPATSSSASSSVSSVFREPEPVISFWIPPGYEYVRSTPDSIFVERSNGGASPQVNVTTTRDPQIIEYATQYGSLEPPALIGGRTMQRFTMIGMGNTIGYLEKIGSYYLVIEFEFPPDQEIMEQVIQSLTIDAQGRAGVISSLSSAAPVENASEREPTLSFWIPPGYETAQLVSYDVMENPDITYSSTTLFGEGMGESSMIYILYTRDERILAHAAQYHPLEQVTVGGKEYLFFRMDGMGDSVGYIWKARHHYVMVDFTFPPAQKVMTQVMESLSFVD